MIFVLLFGLYHIFLHYAGPQGKEILVNYWNLIRTELVTNGLWLFLCICILPGFVLPVAPLLTLAGLWGEEHGAWIACFWCSLSLSVNMSWTYWIARGPARAIISKVLTRSRFQLPNSPPKDLLEWSIILRLTPGVPFIFSNYALGMFKMPFKQYLLISIPVLTVTACGYVLAFAGFFGGEWKYIVSGLSLLIVSVVVGRIILRKKNHAN